MGPLSSTIKDVYHDCRYIEFYDAMSVPMAIALSGHLFLGQPVMVKPSEAEKNLVQSNASAGGSVAGPYGATDRKLYVGNLHFNMTEFQLKQVYCLLFFLVLSIQRAFDWCTMMYNFFDLCLPLDLFIRAATNGRFVSLSFVCCILWPVTSL